MAAPMCIEHPEEWGLPQEERWQLWEERTGLSGEACVLLGGPHFYHEDGSLADQQDAINANRQRPPITVPSSQHTAYRRVLRDAERIYLARGKKYGVTPFTIPQVLTLIQMKASRLERGEPSEDEWMDLVNYAAIGLLVQRGEWE